MSRTGVISILGATALAFALAGTASAQLQGNVCQVGSSGANGNGTAIIANPGLNGSGPLSLPFAFSNNCSEARIQGCARGVLDTATCAGNIHSGDFLYCPTGSCQLDCSPALGVQACDSTNVAAATLVGTPDCYGGEFLGVCAGNLCVGSGTADVLYLLAFSQATSDEALAVCPAPPLGTGGSLTEASFSGVIVY